MNRNKSNTQPERAEAVRPTTVPRVTPHDVQLPTIVLSNSYGNPENLKSEMEITMFITSEGDITNERVTFPILSYIRPTHKDNIKEIWDTQIEGIVAIPNILERVCSTYQSLK